MDAALIFWVAAAALLYAYFGFPVLLAIAGAVLQRRVAKAPITPSISLIIAAYNEQEVIAARLENALALDYPREHLEIIVASDGSWDATAEIAERYGVQVLRLPRQGKIHALRAAVEQASGDILVFSDANTMYDRAALRWLAANFADPCVGGVAGHTAYRLSARREASADGENLYWSYDTFLKRLETLTGSVVSAHGGIYALRRDLFRFPSDTAVTDDFALSTAVVEQGYRLVFEPRARAWEDAVPQAGREFRRRVRLMTRGLRGLWMRRRLLNPFRYGFYAVVLGTHKLLRRLLPLALIAMAAASGVVARESAFFRWMLAAQIGFYASAALGMLLRGHIAGRAKVLYVPFFYCMANLAALLALWRAALGERIEQWQPQRHEGSA